LLVGVIARAMLPWSDRATGPGRRFDTHDARDWMHGTDGDKAKPSLVDPLGGFAV